MDGLAASWQRQGLESAMAKRISQQVERRHNYNRTGSKAGSEQLVSELTDYSASWQLAFTWIRKVLAATTAIATATATMPSAIGHRLAIANGQVGVRVWASVWVCVCLYPLNNCSSNNKRLETKRRTVVFHVFSL